MKTLLKKLLFIGVVITSMAGRVQEAQPRLGQTAPTFTLMALNGSTYSLEQLKGKYIVIHFAATWCPFCNAEAPNLEQLYKDYRDRGVQVFIVDVKEDKELLEKSFSRFNFTFPVLLDPDGKIYASYAPPGRRVSWANRIRATPAGVIGRWRRAAGWTWCSRHFANAGPPCPLCC